MSDINDTLETSAASENEALTSYEEDTGGDIRDVLSGPIKHNLHSILGAKQYNESNQINGVVIGEIVTLDDETTGQKIYVNYAGNPYTSPLFAISTVKITKQELGKQVVLSFDHGNPSRPIIMGVVQQPQTPAEMEFNLDEAVKKELLAKLDGEQVTLSADKEIVLKCGKSSITLTRAGKIIIRGEYLLSRSSGVNKIKGGSVQIN